MEQITNEVLLERMTGGFEKVNVQLDGILSEAKRTNGRVTKLEDVVKDYLSAERQIATIIEEQKRQGAKIESNRDFINKAMGALVIMNIALGVALVFLR